MASEKKLDVDIRLVGAMLTKDSLEVVTEYSGPDARQAISDHAQEEMARGAEVEIIDMSTGDAAGSQTFSGFGDGKWHDIKNDPQTHNGRLKQVYTRNGMLQ
ncbi:MAG: hypothetical protein AAB557_03590 [Patescibacteria group bacterium]